jgi:hypothetical protein
LLAVVLLLFEHLLRADLYQSACMCISPAAEGLGASCAARPPPKSLPSSAMLMWPEPLHEDSSRPTPLAGRDLLRDLCCWLLTTLAGGLLPLLLAWPFLLGPFCVAL